MASYTLKSYHRDHPRASTSGRLIDELSFTADSDASAIAMATNRSFVDGTDFAVVFGPHGNPIWPFDLPVECQTVFLWELTNSTMIEKPGQAPSPYAGFAAPRPPDCAS